MVTADHGPAVSGAHNTIVTARAGKDLVSCLTSGLLTIVRIFTHHDWYIPHEISCTYACWKEVQNAEELFLTCSQHVKI